MSEGGSVFWCDDPEAVAAWYGEMLGCPVEAPRPGTARIRFDPIDLMFVPRDAAPGHLDPNAVWAWFTVDDLWGAVGWFVESGAQIEGEALPLGAMTLVRMRDPFGGFLGVLGPGADTE